MGEPYLFTCFIVPPTYVLTSFLGQIEGCNSYMRPIATDAIVWSVVRVSVGHTVFVNVRCLSSALPSLHQQHGSVCRHFYSPSGSPVIHMPDVCLTKNLYETWGACVLSFGTYSVECIASLYPQHCRFKTIHTTAKETFFNVAFHLTA